MVKFRALLVQTMVLCVSERELVILRIASRTRGRVALTIVRTSSLHITAVCWNPGCSERGSSLG